MSSTAVPTAPTTDSANLVVRPGLAADQENVYDRFWSGHTDAPEHKFSGLDPYYETGDTEGIDIEFEPEALVEVARIAAQVNEASADIGGEDHAEV